MKTFVQTVLAVVHKEVRIYFVSPIAYAFLSIVLFLAGLFLFIGVTQTGAASVRPMVANLVISMVFLLPILSMRQLSDERRNGTLELLLTLPVSPFAVVLGKWLSMLILCLLMIVLSLYFPLVLSFYSDFSWSSLVGDYIGLILCTGAFSSAALFSSMLFKEPVSAALCGIVMLLPFWLMGLLNQFVDNGIVSRLLEELSFVAHLRRLSDGVFLLSDFVWFLLFTMSFLILTQQLLTSHYGRS